MFRSRSDSVLIALTLALAATPLAVGRAAGQDATPGSQRILSSQVNLTRNEARLDLEFTDGTRTEFSIHDGKAWVNGDAVGDAARGSDLDRSWRELLNAAMDVDGADLPRLLIDWDPPVSSELDNELETALENVTARNLGDADVSVTIPDINVDIDSVERMTVRIHELQSRLHELESGDLPITVDVVNRARGGGLSWWERGPLRHLFGGIAGIMKAALVYGVLFAIAFATIFFGGRRYIENVADTARTATTRSLLVGMAASFLLVPAFILGIIALAISIVGIPALLVWIPLFPVAAGLAVLLGYISVAHAAGEALAERRFYATDWFQRGNSYYFLMSGLGLLIAPFVAVNVFRMAGPWLGFVGGIFMALGVIATWAALSIGLGAVLLTRAGTRRGPGAPLAPEPEIYAESTSV